MVLQILLKSHPDFELFNLFSSNQEDQEVTGLQGLSQEKGDTKNQWADAEATLGVRSKMSLLGVSKRSRQPWENHT